MLRRRTLGLRLRTAAAEVRKAKESSVTSRATCRKRAYPAAVPDHYRFCKLIGPFFRRQAKLVTSFLADCRLLLITNFLSRAARAFSSSPRCRQHVATKSTKWSGVAISEKVMQVIALFPFDKTASSDRMNHRQASTDKMIPGDQLICRLLRLSDIQTTANASLRHSCRREAFHIFCCCCCFCFTSLKRILERKTTYALHWALSKLRDVQCITTAKRVGTTIKIEK